MKEIFQNCEIPKLFCGFGFCPGRCVSTIKVSSAGLCEFIQTKTAKHSVRALRIDVMLWLKSHQNCSLPLAHMSKRLRVRRCKTYERGPPPPSRRRFSHLFYCAHRCYAFLRANHEEGNSKSRRKSRIERLEPISRHQQAGDSRNSVSWMLCPRPPRPKFRNP